jgi:hypothetical protein
VYGGSPTAIARKVDPAALARSFADEISAVLEVKRLWYCARPHLIEPDRLSVDFYLLHDPNTDASFTAIANALTHLQEQYFDDVSVGLEIFLPWHADNLGLVRLIPEAAIEIPRNGA